MSPDLAWRQKIFTKEVKNISTDLDCRPVPEDGAEDELCPGEVDLGPDLVITEQTELGHLHQQLRHPQRETSLLGKLEAGLEVALELPWSRAESEHGGEVEETGEVELGQAGPQPHQVRILLGRLSDVVFPPGLAQARPLPAAVSSLQRSRQVLPGLAPAPRGDVELELTQPQSCLSQDEEADDHVLVELVVVDHLVQELLGRPHPVPSVNGGHST